MTVEGQKNLCGNCRHFRRHYIKFGRSYQEILDGHCVYPMLKRREALTRGCKHFVLACAPVLLER